MYSDVEVVENADEDFLSALALLHSSDEGSAERLKAMLAASIDKKLGKTLPRNATTNESRDCSGHVTGIVREFEDQIQLMETFRRDFDGQDRVSSSFLSSDSIIDYNNSLASSLICTTDDSFENEDIPRISIPDETISDGALCKICNGDKLGPLVLLECQDCQDFYHPLCHHPPVVDIDVYDPRIVWRCGKCIETSDTQAAPSLNVTRHSRIEIREERGKTFETPVNSKRSTLSKLNKEKFQEGELKQLSCCSRRTTRSRPERRQENSLKRISRRSHENSSISLRKRIGSKLSVTRASSAK